MEMVLMTNLIVNFNKDYKKRIKEILNNNQIEEGIRDIVEDINKYDFAMTVGSCGGHRTYVLEDWNNLYFEKIDYHTTGFPYVDFVVNRDDFIDFLKNKIEKSNNGLKEFGLSIQYISGAINDWVGVEGLIPVIRIEFVTLPHSIGRFKDRFSFTDEDTRWIISRLLFFEMKEQLKDWFKEFNEMNKND